METTDSDHGVVSNKNVNWIDSKFWVFYLLMIVVGRALFGLLPFLPMDYAWTVVNVLLSLSNFYFLHWLKGTPFPDDDSGEHDHLTFWEQIDNGRQYTNNRKFLTLVPLIVFLFAANDTRWQASPLFFNFVFLAIAVVPKLGMMHQIRLFGLNKD